MDKIFILNMSMVFMTVRFRIDHPGSREIIQLLRDNLLRGRKNDVFMDGLCESKILKDYNTYLSEEDSVEMGVNPKFAKFYMYILDRLIKLLDE